MILLTAQRVITDSSNKQVSSPQGAWRLSWGLLLGRARQWMSCPRHNQSCGCIPSLCVRELQVHVAQIQRQGPPLCQTTQASLDTVPKSHGLPDKNFITKSWKFLVEEAVVVAVVVWMRNVFHSLKHLSTWFTVDKTVLRLREFAILERIHFHRDNLQKSCPSLILKKTKW